MKKNIKTLLFAVVALLLSNGAWGTDATLPAGTYYFDFTGTGETVSQVQILISSSNMSLAGSNPLNTGITQSNDCFFSKSNMTYLVITINNNVSNGTDQNFMQYYNGSKWYGWFKWSDANLTEISSGNYYCKVTSSGFTWQQEGPLPSATPVLTFTAGPNGVISTHTAGGSNISSGDEVAEGSSVNLVAVPSFGYSFYGWVRPDGSVASTLANYVFSMPSSSLTLTATFYSDSTDPSISGCDGCFRVTP